MQYKLISFVVFCLCMIFSYGETQVPNDDLVTISDTFSNLFRNYDKRIPPKGANGTLDVTVNCLILDVFNVDEATHEFTVNMYLRHHWSDSRLKYNKLPGKKFILFNTNQMLRLWTPDTFILNERNTIRHELGDGQMQEYIKILPNGRILKSSRITVTASCRMNLNFFPFDRQLCGLELASYGNIGPEYNFLWTSSDSATIISDELASSSLKFRFAGIKTTTKTLTYPSGNQTRLRLEFFFARYSIRYLQDVYFPIILLTVLAFCTLHVGTVLVRLQLSSFFMIAMILFMSLNSSWMPKVSYQNALDIFFFISVNMTFITVVVNFLIYNSKASESPPPGFRMRQLSREKPDQDQLIDYERNNDLQEPLCQQGQGQSQSQRLIFGLKIDELLQTSVCGILKRYLPLSYFIFNLIYWLVVLIGSSWYSEGFLTGKLET